MDTIMDYEGYDEHGFIYDPGHGDLADTLETVMGDFVSGSLIIQDLHPTNITPYVIERLTEFAKWHCGYDDMDDELDTDSDVE